MQTFTSHKHAALIESNTYFTSFATSNMIYLGGKLAKCRRFFRWVYLCMAISAFIYNQAKYAIQTNSDVCVRRRFMLRVVSLPSYYILITLI